MVSGNQFASPPLVRALSSALPMPSSSHAYAYSSAEPPHVQVLEHQLIERDQRLSMQDRLVEDLRGAIDSQRREAEELRRQQTELLFTNQEQARRLADLESLLYGMQEPI